MFKERAWKKPLVAALGLGLTLLPVMSALAAPAELSLEESIALALKNNPSLKVAQQEKDKAAWGVQEARSGQLPSLSLNHAASRNHSEAGEADNFNTSLRLSWPLYTGGRTEALIDQAGSGARAAEAGVVKARQQLRLDATTAYYNVLQAGNMVKVNEMAVANLEEHLQKVQAQFDAGAVAKTDLLRSEVELANARQNLIKAQNGHAVALASFNNIIGVPHGDKTVLKDELGYAPGDATLEDSVAAALRQRPELTQSKENIAAAKAAEKVAASGRLPTVSLSGSQNWAGNEFPGQNNTWSVGVSANWSLFDSGLTKARVEGAKTAAEKAVLQDEQTRQGIELEVRQAYLGMAEAEKRIETAKVAVDKAVEDRKIAGTKYDAGVGTNLDVIDAQLALTQADTNYTQALYDYNVGKAKLAKATGQ